VTTKKRQNWLSKAMKNVIERLARGRKKKQRLVAPEKKKKPPRAKARKNERYEEHARIPSFSSRGELRDEPYIEANVRAFARSRHHLKGGVRFFLFYFKNARLVFFLSLSLFLRGENGEKKYKRALVPSPPGANAKMFGEKRLAFRAEWTRVNAVWCSRREVFFRAMY